MYFGRRLSALSVALGVFAFHTQDAGIGVAPVEASIPAPCEDCGANNPHKPAPPTPLPHAPVFAAADFGTAGSSSSSPASPSADPPPFRGPSSSPVHSAEHFQGLLTPGPFGFAGTGPASVPGTTGGENGNNGSGGNGSSDNGGSSGDGNVGGGDNPGGNNGGSGGTGGSGSDGGSGGNGEGAGGNSPDGSNPVIEPPTTPDPLPPITDPGTGGGSGSNENPTPTDIPEPASLAILAAGLIAILGRRRRRLQTQV